MKHEIAKAAQLIRAYPRDFLILSATCLVALPVGAAVLGLLQIALKG